MPSWSVLDENGKIRLEFERNGNLATLRPVGVIDEDVNFSVVVNTLLQMQPPATELRFDTGQVSRINSCGVREWLLLMERIPASIQFTFMNVGEIFVSQSSMVPGIFGRRGAKILSFYAPYHCEPCGKDFSVLVERAAVTASSDRPAGPSSPCPACSKPTPFDLQEEEYTYFLKRY